MVKSETIEPAKNRLEQFNGNKHFLVDNSALFIRFWSLKQLEGRLLTLVESMGLGEKQEDAIKNYMRREVWATIADSYVMSDEARDFCETLFKGECEA